MSHAIDRLMTDDGEKVSEMGRTMTATEARVRFGELLRLVTEQNETVIVEHRGEPAVAFVSVAEYERLTGSPLPAKRTRPWPDQVVESQERQADRG